MEIRDFVKKIKLNKCFGGVTKMSYQVDWREKWQEKSTY